MYKEKRNHGSQALTVPMEFLGLFVVVPDLRMKMSRISFLHDPQPNEHIQKTESFIHPELQEGKREKGSIRALVRNRKTDFLSPLCYLLAMRD